MKSGPNRRTRLHKAVRDARVSCEKQHMERFCGLDEHLHRAQEELQDSALHRLTVTTRSPQSSLYERSRRKTPQMSLSSMRMQLLAFMNTPDQRHGPDVFSGLTLNHFLTLYQSQGAEETLALTRWSLWWNNVPQIWSLSRIITSTVNVWGKL
ncbi:uncharacterized protein LOC113066610 isoform X3 [Carassius auratus]|uniref:Uncharacterized protein LOC113066610 isoform X3 n=1 Tax=Carassius auratus TaxID=7957 RepID=A0A6P6MCS2_CARAU|nr:uncharacterized protein LOC113066610 isoform X3 [Carassius auratus]XP_026094329.1 uncharacterized protein LOC113066610 isoform X3 [Carassius auratus]